MHTKLIGERAEVISPKLIGHRHSDLAAIREGAKQSIGFSPGVGLYIDVYIIPFDQLQSHTLRSISTHQTMASSDFEFYMHDQIQVIVRQGRHPFLLGYIAEGERPFSGIIPTKNCFIKFKSLSGFPFKIEISAY